MNLKFYLLFLASITCCHLVAQKSNSSREKQIGFLVSGIIPTNYFGAAALYLDEDHSSLELSTKVGYQFGMVIKTRYSDKISIENGITFCRRNYNIYGQSFYQGETRDTSDFGYINYRIPIKGIVDIQLSKQLFMNTGIGFGLDFYASSVQSTGRNKYINHVSIRNNWINACVTGDLGLELRNQDIGDFYFGATVNIPAFGIAETRLKYYYDGSTADEYNPFLLAGNFLGLKIIYFLPKNMENKKVEN